MEESGEGKNLVAQYLDISSKFSSDVNVAGLRLSIWENTVQEVSERDQLNIVT